MMALVTGGASCGKSQLAEQLCMALGSPRVYLAAMQPFGDEGARRVARHQAARAGKGFETVECYRGLESVLNDARLNDAVVLLEDLGNVVANALFGSTNASVEQDICKTLEARLSNLAQLCRHVVIVGNEVGSDGITYDPETRRYQEVLGQLVCYAAVKSQLVVECVAGVPHVLACNIDPRADAADEAVTRALHVCGLTDCEVRR